MSDQDLIMMLSIKFPELTHLELVFCVPSLIADDENIHGMTDAKGDTLEFGTPIYVISNNTDAWLIQVEDLMISKVRAQVNACYAKFVGNLAAEAEDAAFAAIEANKHVQPAEI